MKQIIIIASCSVLLFLNGCGTERIKDYQAASLSINERTAQESGVEVALDPFVESLRTKEYFHIDAVANGIAILHVRVTNKTADQTFLVGKKDFQLHAVGTAGNLAENTQTIKRSQTAATVVSAVGAVALSTPLSIAGMAMASNASETQRNFTSKEMGDQTLSPGQTMEGFIYYAPVKKEQDWTRNTAVRINMLETKTRQVIELNIPLSL